jgi:hypothetical protein
LIAEPPSWLGDHPRATWGPGGPGIESAASPIRSQTVIR